MTHNPATASLVIVTDDGRGAAVRTRRERLGMSKAALAKLAGVDRGKLQRFEDGEDTPSARWIAGIERALDDFEAETGHDQAEPEKPSMIRVEVQGVYGAKALVVEAPPENLPELEAMVDRIMRNLQDGPESR